MARLLDLVFIGSGPGRDEGHLDYICTPGAASTKVVDSWHTKVI